VVVGCVNAVGSVGACGRGVFAPVVRAGRSSSSSSSLEAAAAPKSASCVTLPHGSGSCGRSLDAAADGLDRRDNLGVAVLVVVLGITASTVSIASPPAISSTSAATTELIAVAHSIRLVATCVASVAWILHLYRVLHVALIPKVAREVTVGPILRHAVLLIGIRCTILSLIKTGL
jgi:hypothetical protein